MSPLSALPLVLAWRLMGLERSDRVWHCLDDWALVLRVWRQEDEWLRAGCDSQVRPVFKSMATPPGSQLLLTGRECSVCTVEKQQNTHTHMRAPWYTHALSHKGNLKVWMIRYKLTIVCKLRFLRKKVRIMRSKLGNKSQNCKIRISKFKGEK